MTEDRIQTGEEMLAAIRSGARFVSEPTVHQLTLIFTAAQNEAQQGDEFAGNPTRWPVVRGIIAVRDAMRAIGVE